jgi:hypothetical protein
MLNIKKKAYRLIDSLPEDQVAYVIKIIEGIKGISISDEDPNTLPCQAPGLATGQ